jgi:hypothetical protein
MSCGPSLASSDLKQGIQPSNHSHIYVEIQPATYILWIKAALSIPVQIEYIFDKDMIETAHLVLLRESGCLLVRSLELRFQTHQFL